jgi:hypothetical protein
MQTPPRTPSTRPVGGFFAASPFLSEFPKVPGPDPFLQAVRERTLTEAERTSCRDPGDSKRTVLAVVLSNHGPNRARLRPPARIPRDLITKSNPAPRNSPAPSSGKLSAKTNHTKPNRNPTKWLRFHDRNWCSFSDRSHTEIFSLRIGEFIQSQPSKFELAHGSSCDGSGLK